jgi:hypothetical protein
VAAFLEPFWSSFSLFGSYAECDHKLKVSVCATSAQKCVRQSGCGVRAMNATAVSASTGVADSARALEQLDSTVDASLVTLPAARMQVNARGLALGILASLATVFALSWAQSFVIPAIAGHRDFVHGESARQWA